MITPRFLSYATERNQLPFTVGVTSQEDDVGVGWDSQFDSLPMKTPSRVSSKPWDI